MLSLAKKDQDEIMSLEELLEAEKASNTKPGSDQSARGGIRMMDGTDMAALFRSFFSQIVVGPKCSFFQMCGES